MRLLVRTVLTLVKGISVSTRVGIIVGSLAAQSINRSLARALIKLAPDGLTFFEVEIGALPLYSRDLDAQMPEAARQLKLDLAQVDALLFVTPEYNRSIPGPLKNAIDWASRPYGQNALTGVPSGVIGASVGAVGTALAQQHLKAILNFCNAPVMNSLEGYIQYSEDVFSESGDVTVLETAEFLGTFMSQFAQFVANHPRPE